MMYWMIQNSRIGESGKQLLRRPKHQPDEAVAPTEEE
jgi:hypothetical protein